MSASLDPVISQAIRANHQATMQKVDFAVAKKQLDSQQQIGEAINAMIEQTAVAAKQISEGYLDVRV